MRVEVVTGWDDAGFEQYARRSVDSFFECWPGNYSLTAYTEMMSPIKEPRFEERPSYQVGELWAFLGRHADRQEAMGRRPVAGWKHREHREGYSFRFDALKFCKMAFYAADAAKRTEADALVWLDADVLTYRYVPDDLIERLLAGHDVAYLGREPKHSETGFVAFRNPGGLDVALAWAELYETDKIFALREWHSAFAFDVARRKTGADCHNLTPGGRGHVWFKSELGQYTDHLKGNKRKRAGRSKERPHA